MTGVSIPASSELMAFSPTIALEVSLDIPAFEIIKPRT